MEVNGNDCVKCPAIVGTADAVCGIDEQGNVEKFDSECLLRYSNCDKRTSKFGAL